MLAVTQFETNFRQRKRYSNDQERVQVGWLFTQFEFDVFKKFVRDLISAGSGSFFLNIIGTNGLESREVQIVGGKYSSQYVSHAHHKVTCELLVVTNSVMTNNQYNLALLTGSMNEVALAQTILPATNTAATLALSPNNILLTADTAGSSGNAISITILTPATQATPTVAVSTHAITVTPGSKARMMISGGIYNAELVRISGEGKSSAYSSSGVAMGSYPDTVSGYYLAYDADTWRMQRVVSNGDFPIFLSSGPWLTDWPDEGSGYVYSGHTVTAANSSSAQVIAALNASSPAAALITAIASGTVTQAVATVAQTNLTGGVDAIAGSFTNQFCKVGTVAPFTWYKWNGSAWLAHADIPLYASLTLANAALPNNTLFYDSTLSKLYVTTA